MCGRFTLATPAKEWAGLFDLDPPPKLAPRYNIYPTEPIVTVRATRAAARENPAGARELALPRWGLIPGWAKDPGTGTGMINARSETLAEKPSFRDAFRERRCLVVADGFYEWRAAGRRKQPYYIRVHDGRPFAFAGVWERWLDPAGQPVDSCAIVTTEANDLLRSLHARMPVIVPPSEHGRWLDAELRDPRELSDLFLPFPSDQMSFYPVSTRVNGVTFDDPECVRPLPVQTDLLD